MEAIDVRKQKAIRHILTSYRDYKGFVKSGLEEKIDSLANKLSEDDFNDLKAEFDKYEEFLTFVLARSYNIRVKFLEEDDLSLFKNLDFK